jgi:hypothetical protein
MELYRVKGRMQGRYVAGTDFGKDDTVLALMD